MTLPLGHGGLAGLFAELGVGLVVLGLIAFAWLGGRRERKRLERERRR